MSELIDHNPHVAEDGTYKTAATSAGATSGEVSRQWSNRPADQRFLSVEDLHLAVTRRKEISYEAPCLIGDLSAETDGEDVTIGVAGTTSAPLEMTNWSFQQACWAADMAPSRYLSRLPAELAVDCLNHGFEKAAKKKCKPLLTEDGRLRAITGPDYGRIWDADVTARVLDFVTRNPEWKVPGTIDWSGFSNGMVTYNPNVDVTSDNTTLYASDRDVFLFLVDDRNPISIGLLENGEHDLVFRGMMISNSETGSRKFELTLMLLRGVCANRCLWGIDESRKVSIRHAKKAIERWEDAMPMIDTFTGQRESDILDVVRATKGELIKEGEVVSTIRSKTGYSEKMAKAIAARHEKEEHKPIGCFWDVVNAITAQARTQPHQDARVAMEERAAKFLVA